MALPIEQFSIIEVRKPNVGENKPAGVEADVIIDLKGTGLDSWDGLGALRSVLSHKFT